MAHPSSRPLPRRVFVLASGAALWSVGGCCRSDFAARCQEQLIDLDAVGNRALPPMKAAIAKQRASLAAELAASAPGEPGMEARKALSGRIAVAIADWDKKVDEDLRLAAQRPLAEGKWIGTFWRNGATHLAVRVRIQADGSFENTREVRKGSKKRFDTDGGTIVRVRGNELTFKRSGPWSKETIFAPDTAPRPLVGAQLGFVYQGDRYLLVPGT